MRVSSAPAVLISAFNKSVVMVIFSPAWTIAAPAGTSAPLAAGVLTLACGTDESVFVLVVALLVVVATSGANIEAPPL